MPPSESEPEPSWYGGLIDPLLLETSDICRIQLLPPTAVCNQKGTDLPREERCPATFKVLPSQFMGEWTESWNLQEQWKCSTYVHSGLRVHSNLKSSDRRLCKKSILDKPWQQHTESLQELIIPGQERKSDINSQEVGIKPRASDSASTSFSFWLVSTWLEMLTLTLRNWWHISKTSCSPGFFETGFLL